MNPHPLRTLIETGDAAISLILNWDTHLFALKQGARHEPASPSHIDRVL